MYLDYSTSPPFATVLSSDQLLAAVQPLIDESTRIGIELVMVALNNPQTAISTAEAVGVTADHFVQDDLRLMWLAASVARDEPRLTILLLARAALVEAHLWDDTAVVTHGASMQWSWKALCAFAEYWGGGPEPIALARTAADVLGRQLVDVMDRLDESQRKLHDVSRLLALEAA